MNDFPIQCAFMMLILKKNNFYRFRIISPIFFSYLRLVFRSKQLTNIKMKKFLFIIPFLSVLIFACNSSNKRSDVVYKYIEKVPELSEAMRAKIGDWAEEGLTCYGLMVLVNGNGEIQDGAVIEARIIQFNGDSIKMRSMESLSLKKVEGCDKKGISRGQIWWETDGEIFQTKEEAQDLLDSKMNKISE